MPDCDGTAVDVHSLLVEAQLPDHGEALGRERFVQLHEIELVHGETGAFEQLAHGWHWTDAHHPRIDAGHGTGDEGAEWLDPKLVCLLFARDHERPRAAVDGARIAGGGPAPRPGSGAPNPPPSRAPCR